MLATGRTARHSIKIFESNLGIIHVPDLVCMMNDENKGLIMSVKAPVQKVKYTKPTFCFTPGAVTTC